MSFYSYILCNTTDDISQVERAAMVASNSSMTLTENCDYVQPSEEYLKQRDMCVKYFDQWNEQEQVYFVQHLISHMCHYQHGQVNVFLKPMLQRDFISALPGKFSLMTHSVCLH